MPSSNSLPCWIVRSFCGLIALSSPVLADTLSAQTIDNSGNAGASSDITVIDEQAVIAYYDTGNTDLKLFFDDGDGGGTAGDGQAGGTEIRTIDTDTPTNAQPSVAQRNGRVAVAYYYAGANQDLKLWIDDGRLTGTEDDFVADADEIRTIDSIGNVGQHPSLTFRGARLAISYYDTDNTALKLWYDDGKGSGTAGDGLAQATEIRTLDPNDDAGTYNAITVWNNHLVVAYFLDATTDKLLIWIDDGNNSGTADDGVLNGGELRTVDIGAQIGYYVDVAVVNDVLAVVYYDNTNNLLKLWYDDGRSGGTASNATVDGGELRVIDSSTTAGEYCAITSINDVLAISYYDTNTDDLVVWRDDGNGGGSPRNGLNDAASSEARTADSGGDVGQATAIVANGEDLLVSYYDVDNTALKLLTATLTSAPDDPNNLTRSTCALGGATTDKTPTLSFLLDDIDPNDVFSFTVQIDDTDNTFASLVVDYTTEPNKPRGTNSFTVGQTAPSGDTYNTGSDGQELAAGTYFWRVRSNDGTTNSNWVEGTSFSVTEPELSQATLTATVNEALSSLSFTVELSAASCETVTVDYATANGTAVAGSDFTAASGTLTFNSGQTSKSASVTLTNDNLNEANENFTVTISSPTNATIKAGAATMTVTIQDNDTPAVSIDQSFNSTIVKEGELNDSYDVVLTSQPTADVTITATPDGEIDLGDGVNTAITLTFTPVNWNTPQTVTITPVDDTDVESEETATITHAVSSADSDYDDFPAVDVTVTIRDNDVADSDEMDPNDPNSNEPDNTPPAVLLPSLAISASPPGSNVTVGEVLNFTITLVNNGGVDATDTIIEVPVPSGLSFVNAAYGNGSVASTSASGGVLTITIGTLSPVQDVILVLAFVPQTAGSYRLQPTASAGNADQQVMTTSTSVLVVDPPDENPTPVVTSPCVLFPFTLLGLIAGVWRRSAKRG